MKKDKGILITMPDGEGGVYKKETVKKFLKKEKSKLTPEEFAKGKDADLKQKFHKENF